ncbi:MAG: preprotein translocase subunit SecA [Candidatus Saganbacteria bacterium]|uniref:Protein translocase subunit SecA n=1 Tax=Candidatus Saganbacteria bacterium TaxID=2575572 RepID=A0A833L135_UNCSA|nr:MAG: preprotein translocase subunit SecA [Candidatus Saganbacteria bacterium]
MVFKWLFGLIGDSDEKKLSKLREAINLINSFESPLKQLSDEALRAKTAEFKNRLSSGESIEAILPEAFALVREASGRTIGLRHFDVQLLGGIVLHQGKIAEMKTGEGKTLAATLPVYLNALSGKGVHVITVNDYLAKRDAEWMGPVYKFLGLSVGVIQHNLQPFERKIEYNCDITYGTNNEFGFDYLRDNMAISIEDCVQRELNYAIVDEVDSILVDEARTPLIISGMVEDKVDTYFKADSITTRLAQETDFTTDEKTKNAVLTEAGVKKVEKLLGVEYLFDVEHMAIAHQILQSLKARHMFKKDVDYVIKDGEIIIVDEFTGRLMTGRRYSDGLHQAIEAKEKVQIREESQTLATITFQNYFRLYKKLAGMTGTAKTEEAEFWKIYNLEVLEIPTHKKMIRSDISDVIYKTKKEKFQAVVSEIEKRHKTGQPLLVGTVSIENSEALADLLYKKSIAHHVLNAKQHEREAEIISRAGQKSAVTISTNMAGRGTDIVLGEGVVEVGGLHVIGTERHESRRIDNQLRGRSGRQGDPGSTKFYVALEDELMRLFGSDRIAGVMSRLGIEEGTPIEHPLISRAIENAQKKVEQYHFSIRKQILEFDDVMNKQRDTIYSLRRRILEGKDLKQKIIEMLDTMISEKIEAFLAGKEWDYDGLISAIGEIVPITGIEAVKELDDKVMIKQSLIDTFTRAYEMREQEISSPAMRDLERIVMLRVIDSKWIEQLDNMDNLKEGIGLRGYGGRDPLIEYKIEGYKMFQEMMSASREEIISMILRVQIARGGEDLLPKKKQITYGEAVKTGRSAPKTGDIKVGRNDPCPCGSGKKYKKCCGLQS